MKLNRHSIQRFVKLVKPFFVSELRWKAWGLLVLLATFSISVSGVNVLMSYVGRDFMTALSLKDRSEFMTQLYKYLLAFALATPIVVFYRYTEERLGLMWRRWFSHKVLQRYFANRSYYRIGWYGGIDNPDQRIEEDIRTFCSTTLSFLLIIFNSTIALFAFVGILWSISGYLVLTVVLYAIFGSLTTYFLGRPLIGLNFAQLKKEADYRYKLVNIRDNAESIALYGSEHQEYSKVRQRLKIALQNLLEIINWNRNLNFFTTSYNYLVTILPTVVVAPLYLSGSIEFGVVTQAGFAFGHVLGALSIIVHNFGSISAFAAVITRLGSFWEVLDDLETGKDVHGSEIERVRGDRIELQNVSVFTPLRDKKLVQELSLEVQSGSLLITGPSGSGKSSILRAVCGLWTAGSGRLVYPDLAKAAFVPQRPYLVLGTFRTQFLYGISRRGVTDRELVTLIQLVGLETTLSRIGGLEAVLDWTHILSTGEQQRLAVARLLLARPDYAFLDEATTALEEQGESELYHLLTATLRCFVSVGYRSSLSRYHDRTLVLHGDGGWHIEENKR